MREPAARGGAVGETGSGTASGALAEAEHLAELRLIGQGHLRDLGELAGMGPERPGGVVADDGRALGLAALLHLHGLGGPGGLDGGLSAGDGVGVEAADALRQRGVVGEGLVERAGLVEERGLAAGDGTAEVEGGVAGRPALDGGSGEAAVGGDRAARASRSARLGVVGGVVGCRWGCPSRSRGGGARRLAGAAPRAGRAAQPGAAGGPRASAVWRLAAPSRFILWANSPAALGR